MEGIITAIKGLLEVLERMAGGKKRAQAVFWVVFLLVIALAAKPAWDSVAYVVAKVNITSPIANAIVSLLLVLVGFLVMFAVLTLIAAIPGQFLRSMLDSHFRIHLNDTYIALLSFLKSAKNTTPEASTQIEQLLEDVQYIYAQFRKSKTNIFVSWVVPTYFRKDPSKWKLVSKETERSQE